MIIALLTKGIDLYILAFASAILHESGHLLTAKVLGYTIEKVTVLPMGINGKIKEEITDKTHNFLISLAGPFVNMIIALGASKYNLYNVAICNIYMLVFNLLPVLPLDGGRIFSSFYDNEKLNQIIKFFTYAVVIFTLLSDFINNSTINVSLIWVLLFTCFSDSKHYASIKKAKNDTILVQGDSLVYELLRNNNSLFLVYEGNTILGILKYDDIYNAAMDGLYYLNTKELVTERIKNGHPKVR